MGGVQGRGRGSTRDARGGHHAGGMPNDRHRRRQKARTVRKLFPAAP